MIVQTFDEARSLVARRFGPQWRPSAGTFMVADWGQESAGMYRVIYGAREQLLANEDLDSMLVDPLVTFVFRDSGDIVQVPMIDALDALDQMRNVGTPPSESA